MAKVTDMGKGARAALLAGGAAVAALAAYGGWSFSEKAPPVAPIETSAVAMPAATEAPSAEPAATEAAPAQPSTAEPEAIDTAAAEPAAPDPATQAPDITETAPATPVAAAPQADTTGVVDQVAAPLVPSFDVVRVEPDGTAVVAGKAEPGAKIILRVDGAEITATTADINGNFAALFVLDGSAAPRLLTMTSILPDDREIAAVADVALAPTEAPVAVATATPETIATPDPPKPADPDLAVPDPAVPEAAVPAADVPDTVAPDTVAPDAVVADAAAPDVGPATPDTAAKSPAALLVTKDGVNVLQSSEPSLAGPAVDLTIDTISYTPAGDVQLAGRAASGAFLRIYLDNTALLDVVAGQNGLWASTMPAIAPGIYTLRVDQLAADGTVTSRFETPFKRETPEALAAATQVPAPLPEPGVDIAAVNPETKAPISADPVPEIVSEPANEPVTEIAPATDAAAPAKAAASPASTPAAPISVTVQPGFTLWGIATQQFGEGVLYVQVYEANKDKIRDPDLIYPGQVFVIPKARE